MKATTIFLIIIVILIAVLVGLYFWGKKLEKKRAENEEQVKSNAQTVPMLIIDKKKMKMKEAGFPSMVLENTPKYLRGAKVPVVKAKVGPKITTFLCDESIFPLIPVKKEVKAVVSGIYITSVRGIRGSLETPAPKKKGFFARFKKNN